MICNVLVSSSDKALSNGMCNILARQDGLNVIAAYTNDETITVLRCNPVNIIVFDMDSGEERLELLKTIRQNWHFCNVILYSYARDFELLYTAAKCSKTRYVLKSEGIPSLVEQINAVFCELAHNMEANEVTLTSRKLQMEANEIVKNDVLLKMIRDNSFLQEDESIPIAVDFKNDFILVLASCHKKEHLGYVETLRMSHNIAKLAGAYLRHCVYEYVVDSDDQLIFFIQQAGMEDEQIEGQFDADIMAQLEKAKEDIYASEGVSLSFTVGGGTLAEPVKERIFRSKKGKIESLPDLPARMANSDMQKFLRVDDFVSNGSSASAMALVYRVISHIHKNIFNPDYINLPYIAELVHFNPSYLSRLFKKVANISISDYIMECKLVQAKHLLKDSDTKIHDIAESLGYTSQSNFTRVFKKATGMTPHDFRSQSNWGGRFDEKMIGRLPILKGE